MNKIRFIFIIFTFFFVFSCNKYKITKYFNLSEHFAHYVDVALDNNGNIYVAFKDFAHKHRFSVKKIDGDLNVSNNADLTITGTVYVTGNIVISNGAKLRLGGNYGSLSGIVLADGSINITNNSVFYGNGAGTYLLFLSNKTGTAITIGNNANTVIFYASRGNVNISNNAILKEVTGYQITLSNGAQIIYESGLASAKFSSGSGAGWAIESWKEVE